MLITLSYLHDFYRLLYYFYHCLRHVLDDSGGQLRVPEFNHRPFIFLGRADQQFSGLLKQVQSIRTVLKEATGKPIWYSSFPIDLLV